MDLFDFSGTEQDDLYFEENQPPEVSELLEQAAELYSEGEGEMQLLRAYFLAPESLAVLVSLYRYYYYQHRYQDVLVVANYALKTSGQRLQLPEDWRDLEPHHINSTMSMGLIRFYLLALKGAAYVKLRVDELDEGEQMIDKVILLDPEDRLGASVLKEVLNEKRRKPRLVVSNP
ncbi:hypothetical protein [Candidatus Albibeggiatoa sp. nov. BB20]|uniref:hypothetical protein n=1 Tax=Candidatus Albibeggiatoa sp. nov. BB20 TaxID=3162723 RepID=UPI0033653B90